MRRHAAVVALGFVLMMSNAGAAVFYVDCDNAAGPHDGTSWARAFTGIQEGIDAASAAGGGEVWVAEGAYGELRTSYPHGDGLNTGSVMMKPGVHIYGGFAGSETSRGARLWRTHVTTINGTTAREGEPASHVVVGASNATLDGFTITGGYASGLNPEGHERDREPDASGGGMYNAACAPTVANCTFTGNRCYAVGLAMYNTNGASPDIRNCVFTGNADGAHGGGVANHDSSPTITNCTFIANVAYIGGAGMYNDASAPAVRNCVFAGNSGYDGGGGIFSEFGSSPVVSNCVFTGNSSVNAGGAIFSYSSSVTLINCILWGNTPDQIDSEGEAPTVRHCDVQGGYPGDGNLDADPLFAPGGYTLSPESPCIDRGTADAVVLPVDMAGVPRPQGAGYDMGPYEYAEPVEMPLNAALCVVGLLLAAIASVPRRRR